MNKTHILRGGIFIDKSKWFDKMKIEKINPKPNEVIVWNFPWEQVSISGLKMMINQIQSFFPNNKVIGIPDTSTLKSCGKDELENIISMIATILEEMGY